MVMLWVAILAMSILLYVLLDGFDLGIGMLFGFAHGEERRREILRSVAPIWDGNEIWFVVTGVVLWGAFSIVYTTLLSAFYLPLLVMFAGLVLRSVAFGFCNKSRKARWIWDWSFAGGSFAATFIQGVIVGALVEGLPIENGRYAGGDFGWLTPFAVLCGLGLCLGYALLGACWLIYKSETDVRETALHQMPDLALGVAIFLVFVLVHALGEHLPIMHRWIDRPYLFVFPTIGAAAAIMLAISVLRRNIRWPFYMASLIFASAFGTLVLSFWPYMIPFAITIDEAAAPQSGLSFTLWGEGLLVFPLTLVYAFISHMLFRGRIMAAAGTTSVLVTKFMRSYRR
jgi:cytochrome bd ubiquinol oxidase subunit II